MAAPIRQTGIRGFLVWFQREQPALFNKIAPQLPKVAPQAFGRYLQDQRKLRQIYKTGVIRRSGVKGFGDYAAYSLPELSVSAPATAPIAVNYTSQLSTSPITSSYTAYASSGPVAYAAGATPSLPPIAAAANSGSASTPIANAIAQTVGAASAIYMTNQQAALQQSVVQSQLARAAAGLPPLNTSLAQLGVPTVAGGGISTTSGLLFLGIGAAVLLALTGSKKS